PRTGNGSSKAQFSTEHTRKLSIVNRPPRFLQRAPRTRWQRATLTGRHRPPADWGPFFGEAPVRGAANMMGLSKRWRKVRCARWAAALGAKSFAGCLARFSVVAGAGVEATASRIAAAN